MKKFLYYLFLVLGCIFIASGVMELFLLILGGPFSSAIVSGFLVGVLFLFFAKKMKKRTEKKEIKTDINTNK